MKLLFVRHGESVNNRDGIIHGWLGGELSEKGRTQAREAGAVLQKMNPTLIFSSDLNRAAQTALEIKNSLPKAVNLLLDWRLRERSFGEHEGKLVKDYDWTDIISHLNDETSYMGIENNLTLKHRLSSFTRDLGAFSSKHDTIVIVTHGGILDCAKSVLSSSLEFNPFKNTEILECRLQDLLSRTSSTSRQN